MKQKILKIVTILIIATVLFPNFSVLGLGIQSLAVEKVATNHPNVEFNADVKDNNKLLLSVKVNKEGYIVNGKIAIENSNFEILDVSNPNVSKIKGNEIYLNQINAGSNVQIEIPIKLIEPNENGTFDVRNLSKDVKISLTGIYKDSTEKDTEIKGEKVIPIKIQNNKQQKVENTMELLANKVLNVDGKEKRVIQVLLNLGIKENDYPMKEVIADINIDNGKESKYPEAVVKASLNNSRLFNMKQENQKVNLKFNNEPKDNIIFWNKQGTEKTVLTLIYDKEENVENLKLDLVEKVVLQDNAEITEKNSISLKGAKEIKGDAIVEISTKVEEDEIYKGKLVSNDVRPYTAKTSVEVNLPKASSKIQVNENASKYILENAEEDANSRFVETRISKEQFVNILGNEGTIVFKSGKEILTTITAQSKEENGEFVFKYPDNIKEISYEISIPEGKGNLDFVHKKELNKQDEKIVNAASKIESNTSIKYNNEEKEKLNTIMLKESTTNVGFNINKDTLIDGTDNKVQMNIILKTESEKDKLYNNPKIEIVMPDEVDSIEIVNKNIIFNEEEMKIKEISSNANIINIQLEGKQNNYKKTNVDDTVIIEAKVKLKKNAANNNNAKIMVKVLNGEEVKLEKNIKVIMPKDITVYHKIEELGIELNNEKDAKDIRLEKGTKSKKLETKIEIINNNEQEIKEIKVLGRFPTNNQNNNLNIKILEGFNLANINGAKVYYSKNEKATEDLNNKENQWVENNLNSEKTKMFLITIPQMKSREKYILTYQMEIPEKLELNQKANQEFAVKYTNPLLDKQEVTKSGKISFNTGIGSVANIKIDSYVGKDKLKENDIVRNGEVIRYEVKVSNLGSETIKDIEVKSEVPKGTKLVVPMKGYEYTDEKYYDEKLDKEVITKIETLKENETKTIVYEVRVDKKLKENTTIENIVNVKYGEGNVKESVQRLKSKTANIIATVKRITPLQTEIAETDFIKYFATIENNTDQEQKVSVKAEYQNRLDTIILKVFTGFGKGNNSEVTNETIESKEQIELTLAPNEIKVISYGMQVKTSKENTPIDFFVTAKNNNETYRSNVYGQEIRKIDFSVNMTANPTEKYIKSGDIVEYTIKVKNNLNRKIEYVRIEDEISQSLTVKSVTANGKEIEDLEISNNLSINIPLEANETKEIRIKAIVNYNPSRDEAETIVNKAIAQVGTDKIMETNEVVHIIKKNPENDNPSKPGEDNESNNPENPENPNNPNNPNNPDNGNNGDNGENPDYITPDIANGNNMITGMAWLDENANGIKDKNEKVLKGIKVKVYNPATRNMVKTIDGKDLEINTDDHGIYLVENLAKGDYILVFEYDKEKYTVSPYRVKNSTNENNSDVVINELTINGQRQKVTSTDIVEVKNNVENINIGLVEIKAFDLKLDKYVSRILVQNSVGTTVKEYNDTTLAKTELREKTLQGSNVIVEYKIKVTNIGEAEGFVRKISDSMPTALKFSSELNKDWYQVGDKLYNNTLDKEKIKPGEAKEVKLTLTKTLTNDTELGRISNTARIEECYSNNNTEEKGENNTGAADIILSIQTGGVVITSTIATLVVLLVITVFIIRRKIIKNKDEI